MENNWNNSVMEEFVKIAKEQGFLSSELKDDKDVVGNSKEPTPVKDHRRYEPTEEYDVTDFDCLIEKAHPKKVNVAESQGEGGLVENEIEQQEKDIKAATNMPSGALVGVHANLIQNLVKIANELEDQGNLKAASLIDRAIVKINYPFQNSRLHKESALPFVLSLIGSIVVPAAAQWIIGKVTTPTTIGGESFDRSIIDEDKLTGKKVTNMNKGTIPKTTKTKSIGKAGLIASAIGTGISLLGIIGNRITSIREGLKIDVNDLFVTLQKSKAPSAKTAVQKLQPFASLMTSLNLADDNDFKSFVREFKKFQEYTLPKIELDVVKITEIEDVSINPYGVSERIKAKLNDVKLGIKEMNDTLKKTGQIGDVLSTKAQEGMGIEKQIYEEKPSSSNTVKLLQKILSEKGFFGKTWDVNVTGELDQNTIQSSIEFENLIGRYVKEKNIESEQSAKGIIIAENGELNPSFIPGNLIELLNILES